MPGRTFTLVLLMTFLVPAATAQEDRVAALARVGDEFISEQEFLERFELLPGFGRHKQSQREAAKLELLYSIIAEKLLAQEGAGRDKDSAFAAGFSEMRKLLARDELYREEIIDKVTVTEAEVQRGIHRAVRQLSLRFLWFGNEADARFVRGRLHRPEDLARIRLDSTLHAVRDTATLIWGDADPLMEEGAYALKAGEISPVIFSGGGYYIAALDGVERSAYYMAMAPDVLRERVATTLRRRKERERLDQFVGEALRSKTGYAVPAALRKLAAAVDRAYRDGGRDSVAFLTPARTAVVWSALSSAAAETLAVAGEKVWSIGDGIAHLSGHGFGIRRDALGTILSRVNTELKVLVQQELLAQEALGRGLDTVSGVKSLLAMWRDGMLAAAVKDSLRSGTAVADSEVWAYLAVHDSGASVPQVQVRELRTASLAGMREAMAELEEGARFSEVIRMRSIDQEAKARGGLSDFFPVTDRPPVGSLAASLEIGRRYGPVQVPGGFSLFEVVARRMGRGADDTSFARREQEARRDLLAMKQRRAITLHLAGLGKKVGFDVYEDRLRMLAVTPAPMMTFRILGFGGRIPAVPFVDPQLDWLSVEEPVVVP
jgi:parvulin-like peptidyl-prolyl isomerase